MNKTSNGRGGGGRDHQYHDLNSPLPDDDEENEEEDDIEMTSLDEESVPLNYQKNVQKYQPVQTFSTTSLYAATPMKSTESYEKFMSQERKLFLFWFIIFILLSPLVFRYAMGSNLITTDKTEILLPPNNATLFAKTDWDQCIPCRDYYGVTLYNVTINIANVTSPNPDAKTPSIAVFASQDLIHWYVYPPSPLPLLFHSLTTLRYNAYHPKRLQDAYIDNWRHTEITLFNGTELACLGTVYRNYLVVCLNNQDLAATMNLGARIHKPPFNDLCFQMTGICGIPCVASAGSTVEPEVCSNGVMDMSALGYNTTHVKKIYKTTAIWSSGLGWVEWIVLITIFLDCFGNILRFFPALSGRPTELESARNCICEGNVILGCTSPFVSEDEAIFLRSLLGRSATVFHTIGGRHDLSGMYLDTILNEKRGKGEANRRHLWLSWIEFITILGRIGAEDGWEGDGGYGDEEGDWDEDDGEWGEEENVEGKQEEDQEQEGLIQSRRGSGRVSGRVSGIARQGSNASGTVGAGAGRRHSRRTSRAASAAAEYSAAGPRSSRTTLSQIPMSLRGRASVVDTSTSRLSQASAAGLGPLVAAPADGPPPAGPSVGRSSVSGALGMGQGRGNDFTSIRVTQHEVVNFDKRQRSNTVATGATGAGTGAVGGGAPGGTARPSFRNHEIFSNLLEAKTTQQQQQRRMSQARLSMVQLQGQGQGQGHTPKFFSPPAGVAAATLSPTPGPKIPNIPRRDSSQSRDESMADELGPQARVIDPFDAEEDLEFAMADLLPLVCFLDGWLEAVKDKEWTYNYRVKKYVPLSSLCPSPHSPFCCLFPFPPLSLLVFLPLSSPVPHSPLSISLSISPQGCSGCNLQRCSSRSLFPRS
jgi:hypothetical protein